MVATPQHRARLRTIYPTIYPVCGAVQTVQVVRLSAFQLAVQAPMMAATCMVCVACLPRYSVAHPLETALVTALGIYHYR